MQNFVDYYSNFIARRLFRQQQESAANQQNTPDAGDDYTIDAADTSSDLLDYAIFFNHGCGHRSAAETRAEDESYLRRWLTFYQPDMGALPHQHNIQRLQRQHDTLNQQRAQLNSPILAALLISVIIAALLSLKDNVWLLLLPAAIFITIWVITQPLLKETAQQLQLNELLLTQQQNLLATLKTQAKQAKKTTATESLYELRRNYTLRLESFLATCIREYRPALTPASIRERIHAGELQLYALESRGILQIPNIFHQHEEKLLSLETLIHHSGQGWCAVQPYRELLGLTRLHYFFGVIRLEHGAIICSAFYDWVSNKLYAEQHDYCSYQNMLHIRGFETAFPTENRLSEDLSDEIYQLHFGENINVVDLSIRSGEHFYCATPVTQPVRKTTLGNLPDTPLCRHLRHDRQGLIRDLSQRIEGNRADATTV